ncbi:MAG: FKBP-type peptidyl-prolyl cis-trans isomerase [Granulosicoccus sp.]|jgi:FKBP-type peptidyl-prolyl cis-trans isomerase
MTGLNHPMKITLLASATTLALSSLLAVPAFAQDAVLDTDEAKVSYGLGMMVGERILKQYSDLNFDLLVQAMKAQHAGETTLITMEEAQAALQAQQQKAATEATAAASIEGQAYLESNKAREGVMVTESGLQYEVLTAAEGAKPSIDDTVSVHYAGTLINGTEFDSSIARGEPASFPLKGVIPGWTEGLQLMNLGSKYRFVIPSDLAYGDRGAGEKIGPGVTLVFEVELLEIK